MLSVKCKVLVVRIESAYYTFANVTKNTIAKIQDTYSLQSEVLCAKNIHYLLTYLLTPWSRVLLEKLASLQLVKKFPAFYGTRKFLTALTSARHLSLS